MAVAGTGEGDDNKDDDDEDEGWEEHYVLADSAHALFACRLRARGDREGAARAFAEVFGWAPRPDLHPRVLTLPLPPTPTPAAATAAGADADAGAGGGTHVVMVGTALLPVHPAPRAVPGGYNGEEGLGFDPHAPRSNPRLLGGELPKALEVLAHCAALRWPALLVGPSGSGKRRVLRHLATLTGHPLIEVPHHAAITPPS